MAKIHKITIKNFRGIKNFTQTFTSDFMCFIGRGDSGKTTILEAISHVLSPNWNTSFHDNDFFNCNTTTPIEIEATIKDVPPILMKDTKFGLYLRGLDSTTGEVMDDIEDDHELVLTIKLVVNKDLEPKWFVINERQSAPILISAHDRTCMNMFIVSDYVDRHFSWNKGNPLYSLLKQEFTNEENDEDDVVIEAMREAKTTIDGHGFSKFDNVVDIVKTSALKLGVDISNTKSTIDFKDINIKDGKLCLHDTNVPFRMKGKGSKRLISIAIQTAIADQGGIILIDEIEQGLEPDRAQHLASILRSTSKGQVFITTHSRDVLVELGTDNLFMMKAGANRLIGFDKSLQGCLRRNPEAFFAHRVIIGEGATEVGICRALNKHRVANGKENASFLGVRFCDGGGNESISNSKGFKMSEFPVCLFCDSDDPSFNSQKTDLISQGIKVVDWTSSECLEVAIFKDLPFLLAKKLVELAVKLEHEDDSSASITDVNNAIWDSVKANFEKLSTAHFDKETDSPNLRTAMGISAHKKGWFKTQTKGEKLGDFIFSHYNQIDDNKLKTQLNLLSDFIG